MTEGVEFKAYGVKERDKKRVKRKGEIPGYMILTLL